MSHPRQFQTREWGANGQAFNRCVLVVGMEGAHFPFVLCSLRVAMRGYSTVPPLLLMKTMFLFPGKGGPNPTEDFAFTPNPPRPRHRSELFNKYRDQAPHPPPPTLKPVPHGAACGACQLSGSAGQRKSLPSTTIKLGPRRRREERMERK